MLCVQSRRTCCIDFYSMPSESNHKRWIRVTIILDSSSSSFPFLLAIIMELFLIARWLAFELVVVGVSSSPFFVLCKIRTRRLQCRGRRRKGPIISLRKWPAPKRSIKQQAARLMLYNTQHSVPFFSSSSFFSPLFFSYLSTTHDIQESQHSSLSRSILSRTLNGHGRAAGQNRQKNAKRLPLFIRVTCSVVSVYPCANLKKGIL